MRDYTAYLEQKRQQFGDTFDPKDLAPQFIPYFRCEKRIEVQFAEGVVKRGTVGVTTGWKPCFLLMLRCDSRGSTWTLGKDDAVVREVEK